MSQSLVRLCSRFCVAVLEQCLTTTYYMFAAWLGARCVCELFRRARWRRPRTAPFPTEFPAAPNITREVDSEGRFISRPKQYDENNPSPRSFRERYRDRRRRERASGTVSCACSRRATFGHAMAVVALVALCASTVSATAPANNDGSSHPVRQANNHDLVVGILDSEAPGTPSRWQREESSSPLLRSSARPQLGGTWADEPHKDADLCALARDAIPAIAKGFVAIVNPAVYEKCSLHVGAMAARTKTEVLDRQFNATTRSTKTGVVGGSVAKLHGDSSVRIRARRGLQAAATAAVFSFGDGGYGRLGTGDATNRLSPVQIQSLGTDNAMVAAGDAHNLVLTTAGAVFSFGAGSFGPLGHGDATNRLSPVQIQSLGTDNAMVAAGNAHSLVLKGPAPLTCQAFLLGCGGCPAGEYDDDGDASTACLACPSGNVFDTLDPVGATTCTPCAGAHYDDDADATTPCATCAPGAHATSTSCTACEAGTADTDSDPTTECTACRPGTFSTAGQTTCVACSPGTADTDGIPSTACQDCQPGFYAASEATSCTPCAAGYIDHDSDPATPCDSADAHQCPAGSYAAEGSTECTDCAVGFAD